MRSSFGCRYWSLLQVVVIVVCCLRKASGDETMNSNENGPTDEDDGPRHEDDDHSRNSESTVNKVAQDCVGSRLMLNCSEMEVIQITAVVLGDSKCYSTSCCIKDSDCTQNPNENHRMDVHHRCDNKRSCTVDVLKERIDCGRLGSWSNNDFERITYNCRDDPRNKTMNSSEHSESTVVSIYVEHATESDHSSIVTTAGVPVTLYNNTKADGQFDAGTAKQEPSSLVITVVVVIIGLIILLALVALAVAVVVHRRNKSAPGKLSHPVPMLKIDNHQNETDVHSNEIQKTSEHKSNYAMLQKVDEVDEADFPETGQDPVIYCEVEQRTTVWSQGQSLAADPGTQLMSDEGHTVIENDLYNHGSEGQGQTADQNRTAHNTQMVGSDAYEVVGEPSKSISSVSKTDQLGTKGIANMENRPSDNIYELKSHDMEDIYLNKSTTVPEKHFLADDVSKISMQQDDDGQTVIENDLYSH